VSEKNEHSKEWWEGYQAISTSLGKNPYRLLAGALEIPGQFEKFTEWHEGWMTRFHGEQP
jgi:hypothetical protein